MVILRKNHDMKCAIGIALVALFLSSAGDASAVDAPKSVSKPNIIYIMVDDAGLGDFAWKAPDHPRKKPGRAGDNDGV